MKTIERISVIAATALLAFSCYEDLGNYEYVTLPEVTIDTSDPSIQSNYAVYRYDTLRITPRIYYDGVEVTDDNASSSNLEFTWSIFQAVVGGKIYSRDTLSHKIALEAPIAKPAGQWVVHLSVTDKSTSIQEYARFVVQVDETISDGWMVLYETPEGDTDLGLIVDDYIKNGVVLDRVFTDLYAGTNGVHLKGLPKGMVHSAATLGSGEILVCSEHEFVGVDKISFEPTFPFEKLFWEAPDVQAPTAIGANHYRREALINNNRIHIADHSGMSTTRTSYYGDACLGNYGRLAEWLCDYPSSTYDAVVYDQDGKRFLAHPYNSVQMDSFAEQDPGLAAFDVNDVGMTMVTSDYGRSYYEYSIMRSGSEFRLLVSDFHNADMETEDVGKMSIDMSGFPGIEDVCTVSASLSGEYLFYGGGSDVCIFKYNSGSPATSVWKAPAGEEVTCVCIEKINFPQIYESTVPYPCQILYIATMGSTGNSGKVYEFKIDPASGEIDTESERVREGFGKIVKMCYKWTF